jgi:hypothetical protein
MTMNGATSLRAEAVISRFAASSMIAIDPMSFLPHRLGIAAFRRLFRTFPSRDRRRVDHVPASF